MLRSMLTAFSNLFKAPATKPYPKGPVDTPPNYRGLIRYNVEHCIFCLKCETVCPPQSIVFTQNIDTGELKYHYNPYLCIYCGECVRACPEPGKEGALWQDEVLCPPGTDAFAINQQWFEIEAEGIQSKEAYKERKKAARAAAQENPAKESSD